MGAPSSISGELRRFLFSSAALLPAALVLAIGGAEAARAEEAGRDHVEEIIVTARRTSERLQDVPAQVVALGGADLQKKQIQSFLDLRSQVPNLQVNANAQPGATNIALRGIATSGLGSPTIDSAIGRYIDGVHIARNLGANVDLPDIARVEILQGPQGTLFGRNVTAGAINFITSDPTGEWGGRATATIGDGGRMRFNTVLNLPEWNGLSIRGAFLHDQRDGDVKNVAPRRAYVYPDPYGTFKSPKSLDGRNSEGYFLAARYTGIENLTVTYKFDFNSARESVLIQGMGLPPNLTGAIEASLVQRQAGTSLLSFDKLDKVAVDGAAFYARAGGHSLTMDYKLSDSVTLKSISAYRRTRTRGISDLDGSDFRPNPAIENTYYCLSCALAYMKQKQFSQEFQGIVESKWVDLIGGLYYFYEEADYRAPLVSTSSYFAAGSLTGKTLSGVLPNPLSVTDIRSGTFDRTNHTSYAVYGHANFHLTDRLDVALGGRITDDNKKNEHYFAAANAYAPLKYNKRKGSYDASANFELTDDVKLYARYAKGYLSGGYLGGTLYEPENTRSIEGGVKSEWFNRRLLVNANLFKVHTKDLQVGGFSGVTGVFLTNIGTFDSKGFEAQISATPVEGLSLGAFAGYNKADYSDGRRRLSPKFNLSTYAEYETRRASAGYYWSLRADADYRSSYHPQLAYGPNDPRFTLGTAAALVSQTTAARQPGLLAAYNDFVRAQGFSSIDAYAAALDRAGTAGDYWLVNLRLSVLDVPLGSKLKGHASVWVKNVTNTRKLNFVANYGNFVGGQFEPSRRFGVDFGVDF